MKKDILTLWVEALRSGRYRQGKFGLRDLEDRFDPIGVLCDLAISDGVPVECKKYEKPDAVVFFGYAYDNLATRIPKAVSEWSGLSYWSANRILTLNDKGKDFGLIADYLEEKYGSEAQTKVIRGDGTRTTVRPGQATKEAKTNE